MRTSAAALELAAIAEGIRLGQASGKGMVFFSINDRQPSETRQMSGTTCRRSSQTDSMLIKSRAGGSTSPAIFTAGMVILKAGSRGRAFLDGEEGATPRPAPEVLRRDGLLGEGDLRLGWGLALVH